MLLNQQQSAREAVRRYVIISTTFPLPTSRFPSQPRPPHRSCSCATTSPPAVPPPLGEGDGNVCFNRKRSPHPPARHRLANARLLARRSTRAAGLCSQTPLGKRGRVRISPYTRGPAQTDKPQSRCQNVLAGEMGALQGLLPLPALPVPLERGQDCPSLPLPVLRGLWHVFEGLLPSTSSQPGTLRALAAGNNRTFHTSCTSIVSTTTFLQAQSILPSSLRTRLATRSACCSAWKRRAARGELVFPPPRQPVPRWRPGSSSLSSHPFFFQLEKASNTFVRLIAAAEKTTGFPASSAPVSMGGGGRGRCQRASERFPSPHHRQLPDRQTDGHEPSFSFLLHSIFQETNSQLLMLKFTKHSNG